MAVSIRLSRGGSKKRPYYRIVVADSRSPRDGSFIEKIGTYNPLLAKDDEKRVTLDGDRAKHWLSVGAQPSDRVARFLDAAGVRERAARNNPNKGEPGEKAKERVEERAGKAAAAEEAKAAAAAEAAAAPAPEPEAEAPAAAADTSSNDEAEAVVAGSVETATEALTPEGEAVAEAAADEPATDAVQSAAEPAADEPANTGVSAEASAEGATEAPTGDDAPKSADAPAEGAADEAGDEARS